MTDSKESQDPEESGGTCLTASSALKMNFRKLIDEEEKEEVEQASIKKKPQRPRSVGFDGRLRYGCENECDEHELERHSSSSSSIGGEITPKWNNRDSKSSCDTDTRSSEVRNASTGTYPADCYSFLALHGPMDDPGLFSFGLTVWMFQISFLILIMLRIMHPDLSTNEDVYNPDEQVGGGGRFPLAKVAQFLAIFIPPNVPILARVTQFMAILCYCAFADESLRDVVTAVETFPRFDQAKPGDKVRCMVVSSFLRFTQGMLATIVVVLLVITTTDVIDIVLNFTAVNFVSGFDDVAFELAKWGKYGPRIEAESKRIEDLPAPACIYRKYEHVRYRYTVIPILISLLAMVTAVSWAQDKKDVWITETLRVEFSEERSGNLVPYSGCYKIDTDMSDSNPLLDKRASYNSFQANTETARFGYCRDHRKWFMYKGNNTSACNTLEEDILAYSDTTYHFDISAVFEDSWFSRSGTPLDLYFFDEEDDLDDEHCSSFLDDGICNGRFNEMEYLYDEGDCCASTCHHTNCGRGVLQSAFNTSVSSANGFQNCIDPKMEPLTVLINNVWCPNHSSNSSNTMQSIFASGVEPSRPPLILICNSYNVLDVSIDITMIGGRETVMVEDGASCVLRIKNDTSAVQGIYFVQYTVYHGDEASLDGSNPIVILRGDSYIQETAQFHRIPECFLSKLLTYTNITAIYSGNKPQNKAINWLMEDSSEASSCLDDFFIERYALAVINFAAPIVEITNLNETSYGDDQLWIKMGQPQCMFRNVACRDGAVTELDLGSLSISGTISTEMGLLKHLTRINMNYNQISGTIPSEIEGWSDSLIYFTFNNNSLTGSLPSGLSLLPSLQWLSVENNKLTGTIFTELGLMSSLKMFWIEKNELSGTIPSEVGQMKNLQGLFVYENNLSGSIPNEVGRMTSLKSFMAQSNGLTSTIPSFLGELTSVTHFSLENNSLSGTIPSELGNLSELEWLLLGNNGLTGSVPEEVLKNKNYNFQIYGNQLLNLIPVDGETICSEVNGDGLQGEHYCNCGSACSLYPEQCACEEGKTCCTAYELTPCVVCQEGLQNPELYINLWDATCEISAEKIRINVDFLGTNHHLCNTARAAFKSLGCACREEPEEASNNCLICEDGFENPDDYVNDFRGTCANFEKFQQFLKYDSTYGDDDQCEQLKLEVGRETGCTCK